MNPGPDSGADKGLGGGEAEDDEEEHQLAGGGCAGHGFGWFCLFAALLCKACFSYDGVGVVVAGSCVCFFEGSKELVAYTPR